MAKTVGTTHNVLKVFGIKIFDYYSDYICNETIEDVETLALFLRSLKESICRNNLLYTSTQIF